MIRLLKYFPAVIFTLLSLGALSQNEAKKWYFGNFGALDFATNPPTSMATTAMSSEEGCASIADAAGNLLFYTNGVTLWNKSHLVMANGSGLLGSSLIAQGALIVKQPGNATVYFVFTNDGGSNGLRYSVVDMSLAAGMGSVTAKNVLVAAPSNERLCGVKHCNGTDIWVITHASSSATFRANLVTSAGVNVTPVLSNVGTYMGGGNAIGCIKASPNGKKIGTAIANSPNSFELYDFNAATGVLSNPIPLPINTTAYGCEFSPDGTKFYGTFNATLCQWDLCSGSGQAIAASATTLDVTPEGRGGQLQLGPDGKIYMARARDKKTKIGESYIYVIYGEPMLGVIHNPNASAASLNFNNTGQSVSPGLSLFGLPNFVSGFYKTPVAQFTYTVNSAISCVKAFFTAPPLINATCSATSYTINSVQWLFDDPASGSANTSTLINPEHVYPGIGNYNVRLVLYNNCGGVIDTVKQQVTVGGALTNSASDFSICAGESLTLSASPASTYSWSTGATSSSIVVTPTVNTTYSVSNIDAFGCPRQSVQTITVNPLPAVTISGNNTVCAGSPANLTANGALTYSWNNGSTNSAISVTPAASTFYTVTGTTFNGCRVNTETQVVVIPSPLLPITGNRLICAGSAATVTAGAGADSYLWNNGAQGPTLVVVPTPELRSFSVKLTYGNGCFKYSPVIFTLSPLPTISVAGITTVCANAAVTQTASGALTYSWSNGVTTNPAALVPLDNTTYTVYGTDANNCVNTATVLITAKPSATVSANSVTVCSGKTATLEVNSPVSGVDYAWLPGGSKSDNLVVEATASEIYTVTANLKGCINSATSSVLALPSPSLSVSDDVKILPGASAELHVSGNTNYSWSPADYLSCSNCDSPIATPAESIQYCVSSSLGECKSEKCINVVVSCESEHDYSVPNAFTPNGDNRNDQFCLQGWEECITDFNVMIFDRWGQKLYESESSTFCWDGIFEGKLLNPGTYIYVIRAKKFNSKTALIRKGNISLIR